MVCATRWGGRCDLEKIAAAIAEWEDDRMRHYREIYAASVGAKPCSLAGIADAIAAWDTDRTDDMKQLYVVAGAPSMKNASLECMAQAVESRKKEMYIVASKEGTNTVGSLDSVSRAMHNREDTTGGEHDFLFRPGCTLRVLISYHYYKSVNLQELVDLFKPLNVNLQLFADSGAYSAFAIGAEVVPEEYIAWIDQWQDLLHICAAPDVIGNAQKTNEMTALMLESIDRVTVLPVFHVGEDWSWLPKCIDMSPYIALGGMVPYTTRPKVLMKWVDKAFGMIPEETKVHGFGVTAWPFVKRFPWASVDSSTWATPMRYGRLHLFDDRRGRFRTIPMQDKKELLKYADLLRRHGLEPRKSQAHNYDLFPVVSASIEAWMRAEKWVNRDLFLVGIQDPQVRGRGLALMHASLLDHEEKLKNG